MLSLLLGKITLAALNLKGSTGSTWPGHVALNQNQNFIIDILNKNPQLKIILIAGTNGKTTTSKALDEILQKSGIKTFRNDSGANLKNGLASLLVKHSAMNGKIDFDSIIFEVDENSLPQVLEQVKKPSGVILLNLFRDQLDRYGEINTTAEKWHRSLEKLGKETLVVANADDPMIAYIANGINASVRFYTIKNTLKKEKKLSHAVDSINCPVCRNSLIFKNIAYSHIGNYNCSNCSFTNPKASELDIQSNLKGTFNVYNLTSAAVAANEIFDIKTERSIELLKNFLPAFGRQEEIVKNGKKILILLSKNPTGLNESIKVVRENNYKNILILLNDRIPDGRDISWIWDVDFEMFKKTQKIFTGGDRVYDLSNRLTYAGLVPSPFENISDALTESLKKTKEGETLVVLPTYSAMLDVRRLLVGRKIL